MVIQRGKTEPTAQAILDSKKKALSDALKKCASLLGVASDVYRGRLSVVRKDSFDYKRVLDQFNLNGSTKQFKEGIVLLPDHYQAYYQERGWNGIFECDLYQSGSKQADRHEEAIANLKVKYDSGNGTLNGFDDWLKKMLDKGHTYPQIDYILQDALNKKAENVNSNKNRSEEQTASQSSTSSQARRKANIPPDSGQAEEPTLIMEFADLQAEGEADPYYRLTFKHKEIRQKLLHVVRWLPKLIIWT